MISTGVVVSTERSYVCLTKTILRNPIRRIPSTSEGVESLNKLLTEFLGLKELVNKWTVIELLKLNYSECGKKLVVKPKIELDNFTWGKVEIAQKWT